MLRGAKVRTFCACEPAALLLHSIVQENNRGELNAVCVSRANSADAPQIENGAAADVLFSADSEWMDSLQEL